MSIFTLRRGLRRETKNAPARAAARWRAAVVPGLLFRVYLPRAAGRLGDAALELGIGNGGLCGSKPKQSNRYGAFHRAELRFMIAFALILHSIILVMVIVYYFFEVLLVNLL